LSAKETIEPQVKIPNHKQIPNDPNSKFQTCLEHWRLEFEIYLEFGAWNLVFVNIYRSSPRPLRAQR
jgi:hypothetical protein